MKHEQTILDTVKEKGIVNTGTVIKTFCANEKSVSNKEIGLILRDMYSNGKLDRRKINNKNYAYEYFLPGSGGGVALAKRHYDDKIEQIEPKIKEIDKKTRSLFEDKEKIDEQIQTLLKDKENINREINAINTLRKLEISKMSISVDGNNGDNNAMKVENNKEVTTIALINTDGSTTKITLSMIDKQRLGNFLS